MKAFWLSLLGFILMMCSCTSKNMGKSVKVDEQISGEVNYMNNESKVDTSKVIHIDSLAQYTIIEEELTITEYDKESGKPIKETNAKRKVAQNTQKATSEMREQGISEAKNDTIVYTFDIDKNIKASETIETKSNSVTFFNQFGKWSAICLIVGLFLLYLYKRLKHNY